jgi:hypothetical protein
VTSPGATVAAHPEEAVETPPGDPVVLPPVCALIDPAVTTAEGETTCTDQKIVTADPMMSEERELLAPRVVETRAPGQPIVRSTVRDARQTCFNNPSNAEQRTNGC